jgi:hypothetical protein
LAHTPGLKLRECRSHDASQRRRGRADIGGDNARIFQDVGGRAFGQRSPVIEDVDTV